MIEEKFKKLNAKEIELDACEKVIGGSIFGFNFELPDADILGAKINAPIFLPPKGKKRK